MSDEFGPYVFEMAARIFGQHLPLEAREERETLLIRLEALLILRASFEAGLKRGPISPGEDAQRWHTRMYGEAFELLRQADSLFPDLIGRAPFEVVFPDPVEGHGPSELRGALASRLRHFSKLLSMPNWTVPLNLLRMEIEDMDGGDVPIVLTPKPRNPGQAKQPTRVARMRLHALCWNVHLKAKGISASERQVAISGAYKATWDTIRKWREGCESILSTLTVSDYLAYAAKEQWGGYNETGWPAKLRADGAHYYEAWQDQRG